MTDSTRIDKDYLEKLKELGLPTKDSNSPYVILHMHGDGIRASQKFNFQVYTGKNGLRLVTNDKPTLDRLLSGEGNIDITGKRIITLDDSGVGFPIGGVLYGVYDAATEKFYLKEIEVKFFQGFRFRKHDYLERYKERALEIMDEINPSLDNTVIKICTGHINTKAKEALREKFPIVEVDEIGEPLQGWLEKQNRKYIELLVKKDIYYDPKGLSKEEISRRFYSVVEFAEKNNLMHLAKTGWNFFHDRK